MGFRPFVFGLATRLGLGGSIANDSRGVTIEVEGSARDIARVSRASGERGAAAGLIQNVVSEPIPIANRAKFAIGESVADGERHVLVSPDIATCDDCLREIFDPRNRRYRYPFTNCTNCGPRFTVIRGVPYDRAAHDDGGFPMCADCAREYHDPSESSISRRAGLLPCMRSAVAFGRAAPGSCKRAIRFARPRNC